MNEDTFNISVRKFLKQFGITAQREIESTVREALSKDALSGNEKLPVKATVTLGQTKMNLVVDGAAGALEELHEALAGLEDTKRRIAKGQILWEELQLSPHADVAYSR